MEKNSFLSMILILSVFLGVAQSNGCGDWMLFEDEKCFKVFENAVDEQTAEAICRQNDNESVLAIIKTTDEQKFIEKYLKETNIADNVWIGIKKMNNSFKFLGGNDIEYNNWAKDRPLKNSDDLKCVEISVEKTNYGKWMDERCKKKNSVLCEKIQPWTIARLQNTLLDTKRIQNEKIDELTKVSNEKQDQLTKMINAQEQNFNSLSKTQNGKIDELRGIINEQKQMITNLESNPVPKGFIYTQFSIQLDPKTLWPNTEWEDITAKYSGLFFRAEGGQSSTFGQIQEEQTHNLMIFNNLYDNDQYTMSTWTTVSNEPLEKFIITGGWTGQNTGINLHFSGEEIRPRNQAIRIWQRIK